ncbi:MAG: response regulator transcription factor [Anaerolineales bacterium]
MLFWEWLRKALGSSPAQQHTFTFDTQLNHMLRVLAEQEGRPVQQIANELLTYALSERFAAQEYLQRWQRLSRREQQVVALLCLGYSYRQIAEQLIVSYDTIKTHVRNSLHKFDLDNVSELRRALADWDFSQWQQPARRL